MATRRNRVEVEVVADTRGASSSLSAMIGPLAKLAAGSAALIAAGKAMVGAWQEQEQASARLRAALAATGQSAGGTQEAIEALAGELQSLTTFGDDATISAAALLQQYGNLEQDGLLKVIPLVQDMAAALGMDLNQAASLVGRTLGTNVNVLQRYGIEVDANAESSEKLAAVMEQLQGRFAGTAQAMAETSAGSMVQLRNAFGELLEIGGRYITGVLDPLVQRTTQFITAIAQAASGQQALAAAMRGDAGADFSAAIAHVRRELERTRAEAARLRGAFADGLGDEAQAQRLDARIRELNSTLRTLEHRQVSAARAGEGRVTPTLQAAAAAAFKARNSFLDLNQAIEPVGEMGEFMPGLLPQLEGLNEYVESLRRRWETAGLIAPRVEAGEDIEALNAHYEALYQSTLLADKAAADFAATVTAQEATLAATREEILRVAAAQAEALAASERWSAFVQETMSVAFAEGFGAVGEALVKGESGWAAFARAGLDAMAALIDALGQQLLIHAIQALVTKNFAGAALAGAGAAAAFTAAGVIRATPLARGGRVDEEGQFLVGERGPELLTLTPGDRVTPLDQVGDTGGGGIVINFSGDVYGAGGRDEFIAQIVEGIRRGRKVGVIRGI